MDSSTKAQPLKRSKRQTNLTTEILTKKEPLIISTVNYLQSIMGRLHLLQTKWLFVACSLLFACQLSSLASPSAPWPPQLNQRYPNLELTNTDGRKIQLSQYAGRIILLEPIGMSCPACQAFVGAAQKGAFHGGSAQAGLPSIDTSLQQYGISSTDTRLLRIHLLLYSPEMTAPNLQQAKEWSKHFNFGNRANEIVLFADQSYIGNAAYNLIPGFQLIDKSFVLRCDATGHRPPNDLYRDLLPLLKNLLQ